MRHYGPHVGILLYRQHFPQLPLDLVARHDEAIVVVIGHPPGDGFLKGWACHAPGRTSR